MTKDDSIVRKTINFNLEDPVEAALFDYIEKARGTLKFATYIKQLVSEKKDSNNIETLIDKKIAAALKNITIASTQPEVTASQKSALKNFMKK